jgi:enoyl-CoA hydratase
MNAIGAVMHEELVDAWTRFREDDTALVGVLTGRGDRRSAPAGDLKSMQDGAPSLRHARRAAAHAAASARASSAVALDRPAQADDRGVNGVAYAGGLEWACWTDLAIADAHATFGVTCRRWNIGLADGGTQRLPRLVGSAGPMELIITGRVIDARRRSASGLVNEVVPSGTALARAQELAASIAGAAPAGDPHGPRGRDARLRPPLDEGLRIEAALFNELIAGPEMVEGLRRFTERDHPDRRPEASASTPGISRPRATAR